VIASRLRVAYIGINSWRKVYKILTRDMIGRITIKSSGKGVSKLMKLQPEEKGILEMFQRRHVIEKESFKFD